MTPVENRARSLLVAGVALVLVLLAAAPSLAQTPPALGAQSLRLEEGRFLIETITVENAKAFSPAIIISESLLEEGRAYTETELRDAVHRVRRLPLVLEAEFSLRRGSARGLYELVITIRETRRWFFGFDVDAALWSEPVSVKRLETTDWVTSSIAIIGRRFSAGRHGIFYLALGGVDGTIQTGYTHYNLFDRGGVLSLSYGYADCGAKQEDEGASDVGSEGCQTEFVGQGLDPTFSSWSVLGESHRLRFTLGVPIRDNHSVRLKASYREADSGLRREAFNTDPQRFSLFSERQDLDVNLAWVYNTIDDPVFPRRGALVEAGLEFKSLHTDLTQIILGDEMPTLTSTADSRQMGVLLTATQHRPLGERSAVSFGAETFLGRSRIRGMTTSDLGLAEGDVAVWAASATIGHSLFLHRVHIQDKFRDLRWESSLQVFGNGITPDLGQDGVPRWGVRARTGLTYRNTWGVFRLTVGWVGVEER